MSSIPLVASAADVPRAVRYAERNPTARWYVARRAAALGCSESVPAGWLDSVIPAAPVTAASKPKKALSAIAQAIDALWDASLHPRGRDGKFIEKGGAVDLDLPSWPKARGTAIGVRKDAWDNEVLSIRLDPDSFKQLKSGGHIPADADPDEPLSVAPKWVTAAPDRKAKLTDAKPGADADPKDVVDIPEANKPLEPGWTVQLTWDGETVDSIEDARAALLTVFPELDEGDLEVEYDENDLPGTWKVAIPGHIAKSVRDNGQFADTIPITPDDDPEGESLVSIVIDGDGDPEAGIEPVDDAPEPEAPESAPAGMFGNWDPKYDVLRGGWEGSIVDADGNPVGPGGYQQAMAALGVRDLEVSPGGGFLMSLSDERLDQLAMDGGIDVEAGGYQLEVDGGEAADDLAANMEALDSASGAPTPGVSPEEKALFVLSVRDVANSFDPEDLEDDEELQDALSQFQANLTDGSGNDYEAAKGLKDWLVLNDYMDEEDFYGGGEDLPEADLVDPEETVSPLTIDPQTGEPIDYASAGAGLAKIDDDPKDALAQARWDAGALRKQVADGKVNVTIKGDKGAVAVPLTEAASILSILDAADAAGVPDGDVLDAGPAIDAPDVEVIDPAEVRPLKGGWIKARDSQSSEELYQLFDEAQPLLDGPAPTPAHKDDAKTTALHAVANKAFTDPNRLRLAGESKSNYVRREAAKNPNTPADVLEGIARSGSDRYARDAALQNPGLPAGVAIDVMDSAPAMHPSALANQYGWFIARRSDLTPDQVDHLRTTFAGGTLNELTVQRQLATNEAVPAAVRNQIIAAYPSMNLGPVPDDAPPAPFQLNPNAPFQLKAPDVEPLDPASPQGKVIRAGMLSSATNKGIDIPDLDARMDEILTNEDLGAAHKDLAAIMTQLKLGGKQRKRYREMLDEHFGVDATTSKSSVVSAKAVSDGLSPDNPLKAKLDAKLEVLDSVPGFDEAAEKAQAAIDEMGPVPTPKSFPDVVTTGTPFAAHSQSVLEEFVSGKHGPGPWTTGPGGQVWGTMEQAQAEAKRRRDDKNAKAKAARLAAKPKTLGGDQPALPPTLGLPAPAAAPGAWPGPAPKPGAKVYTHPQGARIYVNPDGSMEAYGANGKKKNTSATPENLATGHGKWTELKSGAQTPTAKSTNSGSTAVDAGIPVKDLSDADLVGKYKVDLADGLDIRDSRRELVRRGFSIPDAADGKLVKKAPLAGPAPAPAPAAPSKPTTDAGAYGAAKGLAETMAEQAMDDPEGPWSSYETIAGAFDLIDYRRKGIEADLAAGDKYITIKVPSGSEVTISADDAREALAALDKYGDPVKAADAVKAAGGSPGKA